MNFYKLHIQVSVDHGGLAGRAKIFVHLPGESLRDYFPTRRQYVMSHTCAEVRCKYGSTMQPHSWGQRLAVITYLGSKVSSNYIPKGEVHIILSLLPPNSFK